MRLGLVALLVAAASVQALGQQPAFEVASIRPSPPDASGFSMQIGRGAVRFVNMSLRGIIVQAYGLGAVGERPDMSGYSLAGGPASILARNFNVDAKASGSPDLARTRLMLQTLLAERFRLRIRKETRQIPIYVLTVARKELGPGIRRSQMDCVAIRAEQMRSGTTPRGKSQCWADRSEFTEDGVRPFRSAGSMAHFVDRAQNNVDRPLFDQTGLTGNFEWATRFRAPSSSAGEPMFFDAVQRDFGLRIEPRTGPYEVYVIDGVDLPTPN